MLVGGIDSIPNAFKQKLNALFLINPEEIRWYITGIIVYLFQKRQNPSVVLSDSIATQKAIYQANYTLHDTRCRTEYGIAVGIILIWTVTTGSIYYDMLWIEVVPLILRIARYVSMWYVSRVLPPLPIIHECIEIIKYVYHKRTTLSGMQWEWKK